MADQSGPYFEGQNPGPCGCHYPDIVRMNDIRHPDGGVDREYNCAVHGVFTVRRPDIKYDPELHPNYMTPEELNDFRTKERRRLLALK